MSDPVRVGIAGYGIVGRRRQGCIANNSKLQFVAACDRNPDAGIDLPDGATFHETYGELLDQDLEGVFVCMSNDMAAEVTAAALGRGLHVFCEKPPARTMEELEQVLITERMKPDLRLMYGFNHRYHEAVEDALGIVRSGELGAVVSLRGVYGKSQLVTFDQPDWRTKRSIAGGGVLLDQGIHLVDLLRLFGGEFDQVESVVSNAFWDFDVEDNAYALMRSNTGVVAMLHSSATQWRHRFSLDITLERGSVDLAGILTSSKSYGSETLTVVRSDPANDRGEPRETRTLYNSDPSWQREVDEFARVLVDGSPVTAGSSADALATLALVTSIYYQDVIWRDRYGICDPKEVLARLMPGVSAPERESG